MENQVIPFALDSDPLLALAPEVILSETLESLIASAETTFGGEACEAFHDGQLVEVEVVCDAKIVEAVYDANSCELLDAHVQPVGRRGKRVVRALDRAVLTLVDAMDVAKGAVGPGESLEAGLRTTGSDGGRRFEVILRTSEGVYEIQVDSASGRLVRVVPR
ncbi:MAG: hypothetical protein AAGA68_00900 [Pseudomonadota bacterium]